MKNLNGRISLLLKEKYSIYPVLTGALFLINEYRNNSAFNTVWQNLYLFFIISAFVFIVDFLTKNIIKDRKKAAIIAGFFIMFNLFYQDIYSILKWTGILDYFSHPEVFILPLLVMIWFGLIFLVLRTKKNLSNLNLYLNTLVLVLVIFEIFFYFTKTVDEIELADSSSFITKEKDSIQEKPDIYYIVLDSYTSIESLRKYWNYDNEPFISSLKKIGFSVIDSTRSEYTFTPYCIAANLNSSYLLLDTAKKYNERNLTKLIRENHFYSWLSKNNYSCYNYSLFDAFGQKKYYDPLSYNHFLGRTIWYTNSLKFYHFIKPSSLYIETNLEIFSILRTLPVNAEGRPRFIYAHLMTPHSPFIFNSDGTRFSQNSGLNDKEKYLKQMEYVNRLTLEAVDHIMNISRSKPIIIIQGDHGFRYLNNVSDYERLQEAHSFFYAAYIPDYLKFDETLKPLQVFRKVSEAIDNQN
jgi:hypothetical protein